MKHCPKCGGNVATWCKQCTYCNTIISTCEINPSSKSKQHPQSSNAHVSLNPSQTPQVYKNNKLPAESILTQHEHTSNQQPLSSSTPSSPSSSTNISSSQDKTLPNRSNRTINKSISKQKRSDTFIGWGILSCSLIFAFITLNKSEDFSSRIHSANSLLDLVFILLTVFIYACLFCLFSTYPIYIICHMISFLRKTIGENNSRQKCSHGILNGNAWDAKTGKKKCPLCQILVDDQIHQQEKLLAQQQQQKKYQDQYIQDLAIAIEKRKNTLVFNEKTIHDITPQAFEDMIATLFRKLGYRVEQTPYSNDGGKDAIIYKNGEKYLVECKRYKSDAAIGRPLMQKLHAAMVEEQATGGFFVATCRYTQEAIDYGKRFHIETIDFIKLLSMLSQNRDLDPTSNLYTLTCRECGEVISFTLWDDTQFKKCSNGHITRNIFWGTSAQDEICPKCGTVMKKLSSSHGIRYICSNEHCSRTVHIQNKRIKEYIDYL